MELNYSFTKICAEVRRRNNERTDKKKKLGVTETVTNLIVLYITFGELT